MLVHASASEEVPINAKAALEAAHEAIQSFFLLYGLFESEAKVWWVFNHRAFLEALCIGNVLRDQMNQENGKELLAKDPLFLRAKADIGEFLLSNFCGKDLKGRNSANDRDHAVHEWRGRWWI